MMKKNKKLSPQLIKKSLAIGLVISSIFSASAQPANDELTINSATFLTGGDELGATREEGQLDQLFTLQKDLVYQILQQTGIDPTQLSAELKAKIDAFQTTNVEAFYKFCDCLDFMDHGLYKEAKAACDEAVKLDPNFQMAKKLSESMPTERQTSVQIAAYGIFLAQNESDDAASFFAAYELDPQTPTEEVNQPVDFQDNLVSVVTNQDSDTAKIVSDQEAEKLAARGSPTPPTPPPSPLPTPARLGCGTEKCGFHAAFLTKRDPETEKSVIARDPYFNLLGDDNPNNRLEDGKALTIPQVHRSDDIPSRGGGLTFSVDDSQLVVLQSFEDGRTADSNDSIDIPPLRRVVTNQAFPSLDIGYYEPEPQSNEWSATNGGTYHFLESRFSFAEGFLTPEDKIAELAANQASFLYSGEAAGEILLNGVSSSCDSCGSFEATLDFGRAEARDFRIQFDTGQAFANIETTTPVGLGDDGHYVFNASDGAYTIGPSSGENPVDTFGAINGAVFGGNADSTGGTFILVGPPNGDTEAYAVGRFGGQR